MSILRMVGRTVDIALVSALLGSGSSFRLTLWKGTRLDPQGENLPEVAK